jgi:hypothetical protein
MRRIAFGIVGLSATLFLFASERAFAGPPFITHDPEPVDYGHWEIDGFSAGAHGRGDTSGIGPSFEVNYGVLPELQLHVLGGLAFDDPVRETIRLLTTYGRFPMLRSRY